MSYHPRSEIFKAPLLRRPHHTQIPNVTQGQNVPNEPPPAYEPPKMRPSVQRLTPHEASIALAAVDQAITEYERHHPSHRRQHDHQNLPSTSYPGPDNESAEDPDVELNDLDDDDDEDADADIEASDHCPCSDSHHQEPHTIHIDASTTITGPNNVVHASTIADVGAKLATTVAAILRQPYEANSTSPTALGARPVRISLNMGVRVNGTRNYIGVGGMPASLQVVRRDERRASAPANAGIGEMQTQTSCRDASIGQSAQQETSTAGNASPKRKAPSDEQAKIKVEAGEQASSASAGFKRAKTEADEAQAQ